MLGWTRKVLFSRGGARLKIYGAGQGGTEETFICLALSAVSQIDSTFIIMIVIMILIIVQCFHIIPSWVS